MNKRVCIRIKGLHNIDSDSMDEEQIEVIYIGSYYKRNGKHYVKYDEPGDEEGDISHNMLKISDGEVELTSNGRTGHHMVFTAGQKNMTYYATPFGGLNMGIDTSTIEVLEQPDRIQLDIRYGLEINLDYISQCHVRIEIESTEDR